MEVQDRSRSPSRRTSRVEQVVGRWLRRSRDLGSRSHSLSRDRAAADGKPAGSSGCDHRNYPFRFNVQIQRDPNLNSHGFTLSSQTPILVEDVTPGGPADGRLVPGDQLVKINNVAADDLTPEQAAEIIREHQETMSVTVLRIMLGPKSSFITPEKRAKLRSNPVKVHFAEEVEVNGHSQGNSLLFLPNVLKVYLENGQTKAFKFEPSTTVKDIVLTLKEKLSLSHIEHFSLVLEQQFSSNKLQLLHEDERIQQVVQRKEVHDYRCLFRVCFMPKDLRKLLQEDPTAFEYLYQQGVNDVLQERYAVEMRCNTALRLAALHIQERLVSCGQSPKVNLKTITKTWGIENFVSSTLLRNMREKDLRKAVGYHMKQSQSQYDPKQKGLTVDQARINYLEELSDLKCFGGKSFGATLMLQDRESMVTLLVGARYGVSQVVNHKLNILTTLTEFSCITRIELLPESEKVSLVKMYLQDIKPITLLLEAAAAKDMSCLIAGYCRAFVDPNLNIFPWTEDKKHKISAEEGYVSRCASDSDDSSDVDTEPPLSLGLWDQRPCPRVRSSSDPDGRKRKNRGRMKNRDGKEKGSKPWEDNKLKELKSATAEVEKSPADEKNEAAETEQEVGPIQIIKTESERHSGLKRSGGGEEPPAAEEQPSVSEASDSFTADSRVLTSPSSDSLDALEEDDLISCSSSSVHPNSLMSSHVCVHAPLQLHSDSHAQPHLLLPPPAHSHPLLHLTRDVGGGCRRSGDGADPQSLAHSCSDDGSLCFAELSRRADILPSPPEASEEDEDDELRKRAKVQKVEITVRKPSEGDCSLREGGTTENPLSTSSSPLSSHTDYVFNFDQSDARCYYNLCSNITPDSARSLPHPPSHTSTEPREEVVNSGDLELISIIQPPPGFGDSSSDEEFFDARDGFTSPEDPNLGSAPRETKPDSLSLTDIRVSVDGETEKKGESHGEGDSETVFLLRKRSRKRRSFMETDFTSRVTYPALDSESKHNPASNRLLTDASSSHLLSSDPEPSEQTQNPSPTVSSLTHSEGEPSELELKPIPSKLDPHGSRSALERNRNLNSPSRTRKQEMDMEPDTMESKSVMDLVPASSITVIRWRVDPDGKESADRKCDGKEEGVEQREAGTTENGPFTRHMFLPETIEEEEKEVEEGQKGLSSSLKRPLIGSEMPKQGISVPTCLTKINKRTIEGFLDSNLIFLNLNTLIDECSPPSYSPPPPPPSSPLPHIPAEHKIQNDCSVKERNTRSLLNQITLLNHKEQGLFFSLETSHRPKESTNSPSEEVTDSTNSDVFEEDFDDRRTEARTKTLKLSSSDPSDAAMEEETQTPQTPTELHPDSEDQAGMCSSRVECMLALGSIEGKLGAPTAVTPSTLSPGLRGQVVPQIVLPPHQTTELPAGDQSELSTGLKEALQSPSRMMAKTNTMHDLSKDQPPSPHFLFQACSPSIMGRLSASTLRGKIQNLPLYLSRSQDGLNRAGDGSTAQSPADNSTEETQVPDVHGSVPEVSDIGEAPGSDSEAAESDDSDATLTGSEVDEEFSAETVTTKSFSSEMEDVSSQVPVQTEPKVQSHSQIVFTGLPQNTPGPITEPPSSIGSPLERDATNLETDTPGPVKDCPKPNTKASIPEEDGRSFKDNHPSPLVPPPIVVTTQNLNGPSFRSQRVMGTSSDRPLMGFCPPSEQNSKPLSNECKLFTICEAAPQTNTQTEVGSGPAFKSGSACASVLASGCETVVEGMQVPLDACGCPTVYTSCFSGEDAFDEELTVYEFSCRTQSSGLGPTSGVIRPVMTSPPVPLFLSASSIHSPSLPQSILFSSSTSELSPLLSPLSDTSDLYPSQLHKDTINHLGRQRYPEPPAGFQVLRMEVDKLLSNLEGNAPDRSFTGHGGRHPRDTCPVHFTENKRVLQVEARRLMSGCQRVVGIGQSPEEMLHALADSFRTLVGLTTICLWFSGCDRCDRRNAEAVAGLADVARSFRDFCLAAERASSKRSCQDLSTKLLAKQCTALTASVFCLTQLFRTLTAL
uniref:FERM and PDZ domain-containing protein 1 n=1 Tax=Oryzias sinensis TaxID=183150 RepID=A0A8C8DI51_9TELE